MFAGPCLGGAAAPPYRPREIYYPTSLLALSGVPPDQTQLTLVTPVHQLLAVSQTPPPSAGLGNGLPLASQVRLAAEAEPPVSPSRRVKPRAGFE